MGIALSFQLSAFSLLHYLPSNGGCPIMIQLWPAPEPLSGHTTKTPLAWATRLALRKLHFAAPEPYSATTPPCPRRSHPDRTRDGPHSPLPVHGVHWAASRRKTQPSRAAYSARGWPRRAGARARLWGRGLPPPRPAPWPAAIPGTIPPGNCWDLLPGAPDSSQCAQ